MTTNRYAPTVPPRAFPFAENVFTTRKTDHVAWLAALTMHGQIVEVLGGLAHLARHISYLPTNLIYEAMGIDIPPTEHGAPSTTRARQAHMLREIFERYPEAAGFVLDSVAVLTLKTYENRTESVDATDHEAFADALNHIAARHGLPAEETRLTLDKRRERYGREIARIKREGLYTGQAGAEAFWKVAGSQEVLNLLGVTLSRRVVQTVTDLIIEGIDDEALTEPYETEGERVYDTLTGTQGGNAA